LTAVPVATGADADGNLIPDAYESLFLVGGDGLATSDLDQDGFSDLQEYLDGTDPDNKSSYGAGDPVDMSPPIVTLDVGEDPASSQLVIDWPVSYIDHFKFTIEYTDSLTGAPFAEDQELPEGDLSSSLDCSVGSNRFFRVKMSIR